jgi:hypothetical protein
MLAGGLMKVTLGKALGDVLGPLLGLAAIPSDPLDMVEESIVS